MIIIGLTSPIKILNNIAIKIGFDALSAIFILSNAISVKTNINPPIKAKKGPMKIIEVKNPTKNPAIVPS